MKNQKNTGSVSLIFMIIISIIVQILTLLKSSVVAGIFGASMEMDAYNLSNSIVAFIFGFVAAGISTVVIPQYVHNKNKKSTDSFITIVYLTLGVVIVLTIVLRKIIIQLISDKGNDYIEVASIVIIPLLLTSYLLSISDITVAYFQCKSKYNTPKIINLLAQLIVVLYLFFQKSISIYQYVIVISIGLFINFAFDVLFAIKDGWRYRPTFSFHDSETISILKMFSPILLSTGVYRVSLMVDSVIASRLDTGYMTILTYSNTIAAMVNSLIIGNLMNFCYPKIVRNINNNDNQICFWNDVGAFHLVMCLIVAGFITVGNECTHLLFEHGNFSKEAADKVFLGTAIYVFGLQVNVVRDLVYRYFYAKGDTKTTAQNSFIVSGTNIAISLFLVSLIGFYGIIFGTVCASLVSLVIIMIQFGRKYKFDVEFKKVFFSLFKNAIVGCITVLIVFLTKKYILISNSIIAILVFGVETIVVFILFSLLVNKKNIYAITHLSS